MEQDKKNKVREVAAKVGINPALLDELGYTEILMSGGQTPLMPVWIEKDDIVVWMMGRLCLGEDENGEVVIEVNGLNPDDGEQPETEQ